MNFSKSKILIPVISMILTLSLFLQGCGDSTTSEEYVTRALAQFEEGNLNAAVIEAKNALKIDANNAENRWLLGRIYLAANLGVDAEKEFRRAIDLGVAIESTATQLAKALLLQGKYQEALDLLSDRTAFPNTETNDQYWVIRGNAYQGLGESEKAHNSYKKSISLNQDNAEAHLGLAKLAIQSSDYTSALEWTNKALAINSNYAAAWSLSGDLSRYQGDGEQAEAAYGKAIENSNWNPKNLLLRALVRISLEKYEPAKKDISAIRSRIKEHAGANYAEGLMLFQQQNYKAAQTAFESVIANIPNYMPAIFYLGVTHHMLSNQEQAYNYLTQHANAFPSNTNTQQILAFLETRRKDYSSAKRRLTHILQYQPDNVAALKLMSSIALAEGNTAAAVNYLTIIAEHKPEQASAQTKLGLGLLIEGESKSGTLALKKAIELDSNTELAELALILNQLHRGELEEALQAANKYKDRYQDNLLAWNTLGLVQLKTGAIEEASNTFKHILTLEPGELGASNSLATLAISKNNIVEATQYYESALSFHPAHGPTLRKLAQLKARLGKAVEMQPFLEEAIKQQPNSLEARALLANLYIKDKKAEQALTLMVEVHDQFAKSPLYIGILGDAQLAAGKTSEAIASFEHLVSIKPSVPFYQKLAQAYTQSGDIEKLASTLDRILKIDPDNLVAQSMKLKVLIHKNERQEADELLKRLKKRFPNTPELYIREAELALLNSDTKNAIIAYQQALKLAPSNKTISALALAYWQGGKRNASIQTMSNWLSEHPDDLVVQYNLANLYLLDNQHEKARKAFTEVVAERPSHVIALTNLALLTKDKDFNLGLKYGEKAFNLAPNSPLVQDMMAQLLLKQGENVRAVRLLDKAVRQSPNDPTIKYHWAQAHAANDNKEKAIEILTAIIDQEHQFQGKKAAHLLLKELSEN